MKKNMSRVFLSVLAVVTSLLIVRVAYASTEDITVVGDEPNIEIMDAQAASASAQGMWGSCWWTLEDGVLTVQPGIGASQRGKTQSPWKEYAASITDIRFVSQGSQKVEVENTAEYLFCGLSNARTIDLAGFSSYNITSTAWMFANCTRLSRIANMRFDTASVSDTSYMFYNCSNLIDCDLSQLDLYDVTNIKCMFSMCSSIAQINFGYFRMPSVENIESAFESCSSLKSVDFRIFDGSHVQNMNYLFRGCSLLETVDFSHFNASSVVSMQGVFLGCSALQSVDIKGMDVSRVTTMSSMFQGCTSLANLDLRGLNTQSLTNVYALCAGCINLLSFDASGWETPQLQNMGGMFTNCSKLASVNLDGWDTSSVASMQYLFSGCSALKSIDMSKWNTLKVSDATNMFYSCGSLESFSTGVGYRIATEHMVPNATSSNGMWWSNANNKWLTKKQIVDGGSCVADTYTSSSAEDYKTSLSTAVVTLQQKEYAWTGAAVQPQPKVVLNNTELRYGIDYELTYANNVAVGRNTASVTVAGIGSYVGSKTERFSISYETIFRDVTAKTSHIQDIAWLANVQITTGFPDGTFRPGASVTRADMAAFLFRLACRWGVVSSSWKADWTMTEYVEDVKDFTPHAREIRWLVGTRISKGWVFQRGGYYFTNFRPYEKVARQDMAAFLFRLAKLAEIGDASDEWMASDNAKKMFVDVSDALTDNHHKEVWWLAQTGVSEGWAIAGGKREFRGLLPIARQDMAAFLHRMDMLNSQ